MDYGYLLTRGEAIAWDDSCREQFAQDSRDSQPFLIDAWQKMATILKAASWVIVESYEWESGLS